MLVANTKVVLLWRKDLSARYRSKMLFRFNIGLISLDYLEKLSVDDVEIDSYKQTMVYERVVAHRQTINMSGM